MIYSGPRQQGGERVVTAGRQRRAAGPMGEEDGDREAARTLARERLRRAMAGGDYDGLLDPSLWRLLDAAAGGNGFGREIGALRFAMARLLVEEEDPRQLAASLARVASTIVRATQAQQKAVPTEDDPIRVALAAVTDELDGPAAAAGGGDDPVDVDAPDDGDDVDDGDEEDDEEPDADADGEENGW